MNTNTVEVWRGRSRIDGKPIVLLASGLDRGTSNAKTGDMVQTWILRQDMAPTDAVKTGADESICGSCPLRGALGKSRPCYVTVFQAPLAVWKSWAQGNVARMSPRALAKILAQGRGLRLGSYGDPVAVPLAVWNTLAASASFHTGYTHGWKTADKGFRSLVMASIDLPADLRLARRAGWRTFRVRAADAPLMAGEFICPASEEGGKKATCEKCKLCDGRHRGDRRRSPVIVAHGSKAGSWALAVGV